VISWSPTLVTSAIGGLRALLARPDWQTSAHAAVIRAALHQRLTDPDETNRFLAAQALHLIEPTDQGRLRVARERLLVETQLTVRTILLNQLTYVLSSQAAEVDQLLAELGRSDGWPLPASAAATGPPGGGTTPMADGRDEAPAERELRWVAVRLLLTLALRYQQPFATDLVGRWFAHPLDHPQVFPNAVFELRNLGMLDPISPEGVAARAFALLQQATEQLVAAVEQKSPRTEQDLDLLRTAMRLANDIVDCLFAASGALDARLAGQSEPNRGGRPFYELSIPLLERLAQVHHPNTTHDLVQTLAHLADHDPKRVLLALRKAVVPGHGYEYEPLAGDLVVGLIRRYLADHRDIVTSDETGLTALRELLEAFVRVGWPSAVTLAYQLPDAFR
jgi:hypothetical protein